MTENKNPARERVQLKHAPFNICSAFPSIVDEEERLNYKREFDQDHQEYKSLQAELDSIKEALAELDREMTAHAEGSPQFLVR